MGSQAESKIDYTLHPRVNSSDPVPPRPHPIKSAHIIKTDAEAIEIAHELAAEFSKGAAFRDREGLLPLEELDRYSQSGLWGINVNSRAASGVSMCQRPMVGRACPMRRWPRSSRSSRQPIAPFLRGRPALPRRLRDLYQIHPHDRRGLG
jgi:hypothetical protein